MDSLIHIGSVPPPFSYWGSVYTFVMSFLTFEGLFASERYVVFDVPTPVLDLLLFLTYSLTFVAEIASVLGMLFLYSVLLNALGVLSILALLFGWLLVEAIVGGLAIRIFRVVDFLGCGLVELTPSVFYFFSVSVASVYRVADVVIRYSLPNAGWQLLKLAIRLFVRTVKLTLSLPRVVISLSIGSLSEMLWLVVDFYQHAFLGPTFASGLHDDSDNILFTTSKGTGGKTPPTYNYVFGGVARVFLLVLPIGLSFLRVERETASIFGFEYTVGFGLAFGFRVRWALLMACHLLVFLYKHTPASSVFESGYLHLVEDLNTYEGVPSGKPQTITSAERQAVAANARGKAWARVEGVDLVSMCGALERVPRLRPRSRLVARLQQALGGRKGVVGNLYRGRLEAFVADLPSGERTPTMNAVLATVGKGKKVLGVGTFPTDVVGEGDYIILESEAGHRSVVIPSLHSRLVSYAVFRSRNQDLVIGLRSRAVDWFKDSGAPSWVSLIALPSAVSQAFAVCDNEADAVSDINAAMATSVDSFSLS